MSDAIETQGFKFEIAADGGSPLSYVQVNEVVSFSGYDGQAAQIDVTHLRSDAKEFRMGLQDNGTFTINVNYLPGDTGQKNMRAAKSSREIQNFRATYSDGSKDTFQGYVLSNPKSGGVDAKVDGSFAIKISGDVVFTEAA